MFYCPFFISIIPCVAVASATSIISIIPICAASSGCPFVEALVSFCGFRL